MSKDVKTEDKELEEIKSRKIKKMESKAGEKIEMKAPAVSYEQLQQINISQSEQLNACRRILMSIASDCHEMGMKSLNLSDGIAKLFQPPAPPAEQAPAPQQPNS